MCRSCQGVTDRSVGNSGSGAARSTRPRSGEPGQPRSSERIDGIVAAITALGRATVREGHEGSVYDTRGVISI